MYYQHLNVKSNNYLKLWLKKYNNLNILASNQTIT
jgi:hypothetical protein